MNILYLHGLDSKINPQKRAILEKYGEVFAPDLDYYNNPDAIDSILKQTESRNIDVVIGSSMGGFAGYYVSGALNRPALLFNPALKYRSVEQHVPDSINPKNIFKQIVLGQRDEVINPANTLQFIGENFDETTHFHIHIRPELTHNIPLNVFKEEVESFIRKVN